MIIDNPDLLRVWLTINLRALCDADPAALGKYVLALIRKDKPDDEIRQGMLDQLDVFLQEETIPFVDRLIQAIQTKEYLDTEEPKDHDGTLYALKKGTGETTSKPYHELPNPFESSASSGSTRAEGDLNTSISTLESTESSEPLNTSADSNRSDESQVLAGDTSLKSLVKPRSTNSSRVAGSKDKLDRERLLRRKSRSPRRNNVNRSRSRDRGRRSWSPKDYPRAGRYNNSRGNTKRSPVRRNDREVYDRRRSPRNRSSSPYGRARSPHRYTSRRGAYDSKRPRSPGKRDRTRSRSPPARISRIEGTDSKGSSVVVPSSPVDQAGPDNTVIQNPDEFIEALTGNRCKDYDERGLCMRGEMCPFDHGQNPVVLQDVAGMKRPVQPGEAEVVMPYHRDDNPGYRIVRPNRPMLPLEPQLHDPSAMGWGPVPPFHPGMGPRLRGGMMLRPPMFPIPPRELINVPVLGPPGTQMMEEDMSFPPMHHMGLHMFPPHRGHGVRGRGRGRGGFDHSRLGGKPKTYTNCSLEVKRIPSSQNNISELNSHFVQFGKIINIQINFENDPEAALITFSSPQEAHAAYKSTEAVLGNRFIRVFWHNKEKENEEMEESGLPRISVKERLGTVDSTDQPMMEGGENDRILVSGVNVTKTVYNPNPQKREISQEKVQAVEAIKKSQEQLAAQEQLKRVQEEKKRETIKLMHDLQKKKQVMLVEQIEQQKKLIHKLENSKTMKPEEKDELMKLIKTLQESIETIKKGMEVVAHQPSHHHNKQLPPHQHHLAHLPSQAVQPIQAGKTEATRNILDAEMDLYNTESEGGDTMALKLKVAELKSAAVSSPPRGHSRGRGTFRGGRGSFSGRSRTVDRRPTTLIITGFPNTILPELMAHFAQFGLVPYHKPDYSVPSLTMTYENRKCAENAFNNGRTYKDFNLDIQWVSTPAQKSEPGTANGAGTPPKKRNSKFVAEKKLPSPRSTYYDP